MLDLPCSESSAPSNISWSKYQFVVPNTVPNIGWVLWIDDISRACSEGAPCLDKGCSIREGVRPLRISGNKNNKICIDSVYLKTAQYIWEQFSSFTCHQVQSRHRSRWHWVYSKRPRLWQFSALQALRLSQAQHKLPWLMYSQPDWIYFWRRKKQLL